MPGLSADLTDLVIVELHLIKQKCVDLSAIDLSLGIQDLFIRQDVYDLSEHAQTVGLFLHFDDLALQRQGILGDDWSVHAAALYCVKAGTLKLVGDFIGADKTHIVGFYQRVGAGDRQGEGASGLEVGDGLVVFFKVQGDHVFGADAAPGHGHDIDGVVFVIGADHIDGHREQIGLYTKIFHSMILL